MNELCFACGGRFTPEPGGAVHAYMLSTPGCWAAFGAVLEREYSDPALFAACHRLSVDAYAIQHPGRTEEPRAVQSFWLHAASLWMVLEQGADHAHATRALKRMVDHTPRERPFAPHRFRATHADVIAHPLAEHARRVDHWARAALEEWSDLHGEFARLAAKSSE